MVSPVMASVAGVKKKPSSRAVKMLWVACYRNSNSNRLEKQGFFLLTILEVQR